ncbi:hypothetical protein EJB05_50359 [Eragrostis curvula]|uniref:Uncharacterized protein n=1 Tax=Eragrostis curvula TaxID=38414 RepID=A0A5J9SYL7_9POAL|nr:hypothetical protein EJB05_50359 [Eragrostis curvula]
MAQPNPGPRGESPASQGTNSDHGAHVGWKKEIDQLLTSLRKVGIVEIDDQIGAVIISDWVAGIIKAEAKRGTRPNYSGYAAVITLRDGQSSFPCPD